MSSRNNILTIDLSNTCQLEAFCSALLHTADVYESMWRLCPRDVWLVLVHPSCYTIKNDSYHGEIYVENAASSYWATKDEDFWIKKSCVDEWRPIFEQVTKGKSHG